jgi:DNA-binding transcriptional MerR regulator
MKGRALEISTPSHPTWLAEDLERVEREHPDGLSTQQVVDLFGARGDSLSEATFRKYVQLGLLPRSVRVGRKGKHRGSQGLYPASVIRQIERIRRFMAQGYTIVEIQREFTLDGDIDGLVRQLKQVLENVERAVAQRSSASGADDMVARAVLETRALSDQLIDRLRAIESRLAMRSRMARAAV